MRTCDNTKPTAIVYELAFLILIAAITRPCFPQCQFRWKPVPGMFNVSGQVTAVTKWDSDGTGPQPEMLVAGGEFQSAGGTAANYIAAWDGTSWHAFGAGMNNYVRALTVYNGQLIAAGWFTTAGGTTVNYVAQWNGTTWQPLGTGMDCWVRALTVYNGELIAGGCFSTADGVSAIGVARWNGSIWQPFGNGINGYVRALTAYNGQLIAGGEFSGNISRWDGSTWQLLGGGTNGYVYALTVYDNHLIAGGAFTTAGGTGANYIAQWNGSAWQPLGGGMNNYLTALNVYNGELVAGGFFNVAGGIDATCIAKWNGSTWQALESGTDGYVEALTIYNGELIAGGGFTTAGNNISYYLARWGLMMAYDGDLNHNCEVNETDLGLLAQQWLKDDCEFTGFCGEADLNYDRQVDFEDYAALANYWQMGSSSVSDNLKWQEARSVMGNIATNIVAYLEQCPYEPPTFPLIGINEDDLDGAYFSPVCYMIVSAQCNAGGHASYQILCDAAYSPKPDAPTNPQIMVLECLPPDYEVVFRDASPQ